jgi:hypothetical protein
LSQLVRRSVAAFSREFEKMPRPGSDDGRWKSKFARFIKSYGVESLAVQLDVQASAIYHWVRGVSAPRRTHAEIIKRLARERGCRLTMDAIYEHAHAVRADEIEPATAMPSSLAAGTHSAL